MAQKPKNQPIRARQFLNKAEEEFVKNHVDGDFEVICEAIPDVDKKVLRNRIKDVMRSQSYIEAKTKDSKLDSLMGKNERFGSRVGTLAASELADERRKAYVKSPMEVAQAKKDVIHVIKR